MNNKFTPQLSTNEIINILLNARHFYQLLFSKYKYGMCYFIAMEIERHYNRFINVEYKHIRLYIPEFTREFCNGDNIIRENDMWWDMNDSTSRIKAFDKLINHYSKSL